MTASGQVKRQVSRAPQSAPALWAGIECSSLRVHDLWRDQCRETGHYDRISDLDAIAGLGVSGLRTPLLWDHVAPRRPDQYDWRWPDQRLMRLRNLGVEPIVGLVHHGGGPSYTSLLDPAFPELLASYAGAAARRFPWVKLWTPINEPLTTARFAGLYGFWHPHSRSTQAFLRMFVNQCRAVLMAMRAIRSVIPDARLVQTEDVGRAFSTTAMRERADYENERRWLTFDLLCGLLDRSHPWWSRLIQAGIPAQHLAEFGGGALDPITLGVNHYVTSERFLDHRLSRYPGHHPSRSGRIRYVDIEAVRAPVPDPLRGWEPRLREVWERFGPVPIAVTEVQIASSVQHRVRWLVECWDAVQKLREEGADIRAVTVWAVVGAVDWGSLLTRKEGVYEAGAFEFDGVSARTNLLAEAAMMLARGRRFEHPLLDEPGWWRSPERVPEHLRATVRGSDGQTIATPPVSSLVPP